jgi:DNA-binding NarL/FixJ family response regulator
MTHARVLLLGSHTLFLTSLAARLSRLEHLRLVSIARTLREALRAISRQKPDLVVVDLDTADPAFPPSRVVSRLGKQGLPTLCVSSNLDDDLVKEMLAAGARGLLPKPEVHQSIAAAIGDVLAGGVWFPAEIVARFVIGSSGVHLVA